MVRISCIANRSRDIRAFIASAVLFLMIPPVYVWGLFTESYVFRFVCSLIYYLCIIKETGSIHQKKGLPVFLVILLFCFYMRGDFHLFSAITTIIFSITLLLKVDFIMRLAHFFFSIFALLLIPSIIQYLLVIFLNVSFPHTTIAPLNELKDYGYQAYTFFVNYDSPLIFFPRFHSYFDEAGIVGSFCSVALYYNNFNLKRWNNVPFLIAGLLSFSLFFYVSSFVYILFFLDISALNKKNKLTLILAKSSVVLIIFLTFLYLYEQDNEVLNQYIFDRIQLDDDRGFSGNNRDRAVFSDWYDKFRFSSDYWLGLGDGKSLELNEGGASYKNIIVDYGFVGFILYIFLFMRLSWISYQNKRCFYLFLFIFVMMIYQRPFITQVTYYQLFIYMAVGIPDKSYICEKYEKKIISRVFLAQETISQPKLKL